MPQGAPDQPGPVTQLLTHLRRLESELAAVETARKNLRSQVREAENLLHISNGHSDLKAPPKKRVGQLGRRRGMAERPRP